MNEIVRQKVMSQVLKKEVLKTECKLVQNILFNREKKLLIRFSLKM